MKLLILDVDGVLTDGTKFYDAEHNVVGKRFMCKDFTAIKRIGAAGVKVIMISGDNFNAVMAAKRNIDFYCSRGTDLSLDKSRYLDLFSEKYSVQKENMAFVGDDYFDLSMFKNLNKTFCPADAPQIIKDNALHVCDSNGGTGVLVEICDWMIQEGWIQNPTEEEVAELDRLEATSGEMK